MLQTMAYALSQVVPQVVLTGIVVSSCSVFAPDGHKGVSGAPSGLFTVPVITNIGCVDAVPREGSIQADEIRAEKEIQSKGLRHVWLTGNYYAQLFPLLQKGLQAQVTDPAPKGTTTYNVYGVEPDSQGTQTRLKLEVVSV